MVVANMSVGAVVAAEAGAPEGIFLFVPHLADLVWGTLCFLLIAVVLVKYALPRFNAVLDERTAKIEEGLALTEKAKEEQSDAEARATRLVEEARLEAAKIRERAQAEADKLIQNAEYLKQKRVNEAKEQVAMFTAMYVEYAQNPAITRSRMYYEAISEILPGVKLYINSGSGDTSDVQMLLPLESLVDNNGGE